jgi:hypothetical protein
MTTGTSWRAGCGESRTSGSERRPRETDSEQPEHRARGRPYRQIHSTEWVVRIRNGLPEFIPPKWIDVQQKPRRKALPHLARAD